MVAESWAALAEDQGRPLEVDVAPGPLLVPLAQVDLTDLVDVLVKAKEAELLEV